MRISRGRERERRELRRKVEGKVGEVGKRDEVNVADDDIHPYTLLKPQV